MLSNDRVMRILLAIALPFALMALLVPLTRLLVYMSPTAALVASFASVLISVGVGFALIAPKLGRFTIPVGLVYLPVMITLLFYFSLFLVGHFFEDSL